MIDNFIAVGGFNIDTYLPSYNHDKLEEFCNLFDLSNLIKSNTCFTKTHGSIKSNTCLTKTHSSKIHLIFTRLYTKEVIKTSMNQNLLKV